MKSLFYAGLLLRAKLRGFKLLAAEVLTPSLIMLVTFTLGWAISSIDRFQVFMFADCSHQLFRAQADILKLAGWRAGIPSCLSPLARAMTSELLRRQRDHEAALRHERWKRDHPNHNGNGNRRLAATLAGTQGNSQFLQRQLRQQQEGLPQGGGSLVSNGGGGGGTTQTQWPRQRPWRLNWGTIRQRFQVDVNRSPGEQSGRDLVMALLAATKKPQVAEALEECRWQELGISVFPTTVLNFFNQLLGPTALMTFDEWLLMSSFLNASLAASGGRSTVEATLEFLMPVMPISGIQPGWLALVPDTPQVRAFAAHMSASTQFFDEVFLGIFDTVTAAMDAAAIAKAPAPRAAGEGDPDGAHGKPGGGGGGGKGRSRRRPLMNPERLWAVLEFASGPIPGVGVDYAIRMNSMHVPSTFSKLSSPECKTCSSDFVPYVASGFLSLQAAVSGYVLGLDGQRNGTLQWDNNLPPLSEATAWLRKPGHAANGSSSQADGSGAAADVPGDLFGIWFTPLPNMGQEVNAFYEYGAPLLGILTTCSFALPLALMVRAMTSQRQSGLQHLLEVLGLSQWGWQLAWMMAGLPLMGASFAVEGLLASTTYLRLVEPGLLATAMGAAALAAAGWAVLLGCCFRDPKVAATGSFVVTMASGLPFLALYTAAPTQLLAAKRICCLFWPFAISALLQRMAAGHQLRRYGADRQVSAVPGLDWASATHAPLSTVEILGFMLFDAVLYLVAAAVLAACRNMLGGAGFWGISGGRRHGEEAGGRRAGDRGRTAALELRGVTHRYPGNERRALDDVSLSVAAGEALALVGRNAAGKSTLMAISCGRIVPNGGGTVHVADSVMYGGGGRGGCLGESVYRHIGYCPQGNVLLHDMTALEHLYLALVLRGGENWTWGLLCFRGRRRLAAAAAKLARLVSLPDDMLQLLVSELSGGSRRKLQLAMAMAGEPPLLLLDEITAGVDTQSSQAIWEALLAAKQGPWGTDIHGTPGGKGGGGAAAEKAFGDRPMGRGAALLFISHHLAEVETLADWLGVMDGGRLQSLTSASALRALVRGGGQRVLRITTRPAPPPPAHVAAIAPPNPISDTLQHGLPHATTLCPTFTRSQLLDLVVQHLGSNTVRLLYSNLTFTAVFMGSPVSTMMATAAAAKAKRDSSTTAAADPSPSPLESLLRALSPQQPNEASTDGDAGAVMATATAITTAAVGGAQLGGAHLSGWSRGGNSLWEAQPLVVVRCGVGVPALEDVLLLGLHGLEVRGEGQTLDMRDQGPMQVGATEVSGKGGEASAPAASASASAIISAAATASLRLREGGDDDGSKLSALSGAVGTAISQVTSAGRHDPDDQRHGGPGPQSYPGPRPDVAVASSGGCGALLGNLVASLPPLLTKHRLIWLRDRSSSARLLLLPVMVVGLAILALSIRPSSTGPPAPLHLAWLGQDQPLPVAGLPQAWRHAAGAAAASVAGGGLDGLANSSSSIETLAAASDVSTVPEAASKLLGLVPLKAEWMRAAGLLVDPDREPSSFDTSSWFVSRSKVTAVGKEAERGSMADEPLAPLQAAMVFNDVVTARLNRTAWASLGFLIETMLAPAEYERLNVTDFPAVRRAIEIVRHEDGAMWKMLDFLYDRILLHEVISLARYITGSAAKGGSVTSDAILQGRTFTGSAQRSLAAADGAAMSNGSAATGSADGGKASPGSNIRGGGLFSFFRLAELLDLCQLKVPDSEQKDEALLQSGGGGRALLMSYRPTLNVTFYLLAGLLPPEPRFCPLARHLVEHSVTTAQAARHYMARRKLPVVNLMWNISSPHGLPATLNHLHNTLLHLRMDPQSAHSTATSTSHDQKPPSGGISIGSINRIMQGRSKESALYSQRVYADTAIRVRNYPLPARGTTASLAGLLDHLMLAVVVAMPLSYTTGSFVVRAASEAASGAKQQQLAARRVGPLSYWLSFWLTDLALYSLITAGVMGLMLVGGTAAFVGSPARCGGFAALLVTFAAASLPWGYCIGLRCASPASAQGLVSTTGLVAGVALALARQVLAHVVRWSWLADMLLPLLRLLPPFCLVDGLVQMSLLDVIVAFSDLLGRRATKRGFVRSILAGHLVGIDPSNPSPFQSSVLGDNLSYLAFDTLLYFAILLVVEWQASRGGLFAVLPGWRMLQRLYVTLKSTAVAVAAFCAVLCGRRVAEDGDLRNVKDDYEPGHTVGTAKARLRRVKQADFSDDSDPRFIGETLARMTARELAPGEVLKTSRSGGEDSEVSEQEGGYLVVVRNVRKEYGSGRGRLVALGGLSLQLRRGECYALIGRNGAGKSTAMGVLSGRLRPSEGSVMVGGVQVAGRPQAARGRVALCPQTNPLLPHLTSLEHLVLYSALYGITSAGYDTDRVRTLAGGAAALLPVEASAVAARCRLPVELFHRPAGQLSGGSQRKLSLAIALLGGPQLLLLDEPSAGLDPPARRDVCDAINMALRGWSAASGNSGGGGAPDAPAVVLTTHYAEEAMALCDVVGVLEDGTLLASGPPEQVPQRLRAVRPGHYLADPEEWGAVLTSLLGPCGEKDDAGVFR